MAPRTPAPSRRNHTEKTTTGMPVLNAMRWGTHICHFYETDQDHVETVSSYFEAGLAAGQLCLWAASGRYNAKKTAAELVRLQPRFADPLAAGAVQIVEARGWYLDGSRFDPDAVVRGWESKLEWALGHGFDGLRVAANEAWLTREIWPSFADYECGLDGWLADKRLIVLCCYPLRKSSADQVFEVASSHQFTIAKRKGEWQVMEVAGAVGETRQRNDELREGLRQRTRQLQTINEALVDSEELFRFITENMGDMVALFDLDGELVYGSPSYEATLGYMPASLYEGLHPQDRRGIEQGWERVTAGEPRTMTCRHRTASGAWLWSEAKARRVLFRGQEHVLIVSRDITDRMTLEEQLQQSQKMESLGRLAGGVAHDVNNVLTAIFAYASLLARSLPENEEGQAHIREIRNAAERARGLTRQLLTFARRDVHDARVVDAAEIVRNLEPMLRLVVRENVAFSIETPGEALPVYLDPLQLEQVVLNLVVNARDATPAGGSIAVRCSVEEVFTGKPAIPAFVASGTYVRIDIIDTGTGVSVDVLGQAFEPFFTTKPPGQGTGLGLSIVFGIVKQANGYVWIENEKDQGARASVLLPLSRERAVEDRV
jgi:PAS domain S-box-containing protein